MAKEKLVPTDLVHLQEKARSAQHSLSVFKSRDRSDAYKARHLKSIEDVIDVLIRDIDCLIDTKDIGGYQVQKETD